MDKFSAIWKRYSYSILLIFLIFGMIDSRIAVFAVVCMIAPVILSIFKGRFWCGNICPRGSFYDNIVSKFSRKRSIPKILRSKYFRFAIIVVMVTVFTLGLRKSWGDFYGIGMVFYKMIVLTTLVGIVLSFFFNHRTWCSFCPMGTLAALVSYFRKDKKKTLNIASSCVSCKICEKKCDLSIVPYDYKGDALSHVDCIQCGKCVSACPKKAISYIKK